MKLTPLDVKKQEFKKMMRGYDPVEVDAFLEMVSEELEDLIRDKRELADEVLKLKTQLRDYQNVEKTLQDTLMSAQASIKESKETSSREAELTLKEAELKAEKILEESKLKLAEMKNELVMIKSQKESFSRRLRHLLESQLELIEVLDLDDLGFSNYESKIVKKGMRRTRKEHEGAEKRQLEFGVENRGDEVEPEKAVKAEPLTPKWGKREAPQVSEQTQKQNEKNSRISDQLIV